MNFEEYGASLSTKDTIHVTCAQFDGTTVLCLSLGKNSSIKLESFAEHFQKPTGTRLDAAFKLANALPITDTAVLFFRDGSTVVIRGASANFNLYREINTGKVKLKTYLPTPTGALLSRKGLWHLLASGTQQGCYEPNLTLYTPFRDWHRLRRGAVTLIDHCGQPVAEKPITYLPATGCFKKSAQIIEDALHAFSKNIFSNKNVLVEVSGGYDSTIAAFNAQYVVDRWYGVSIDYPYYEFRFEKAAQLAAAKALSIQKHYWIDGNKFGSYSKSIWQPRANEPNFGSTGIEKTRLVAKIAHKTGAEQVLTGTGGDQLFGTNLNEPEPFFYEFSQNFVSGKGRKMLRDAQNTLLNESNWSDRALGTYIDPAPFYEQILRDFGVLFVSPFSDRQMLHAALVWTAIKKKNSLSYSNKDILKSLPNLELPPEISDRQGKAPYDGVWARSYARNGDYIGNLISLNEANFEQLGINTKWLLRRLDALMNFRSDQHQEIVITYALAKWFDEWGITGSTDITWTY